MRADLDKSHGLVGKFARGLGEERVEGRGLAGMRERVEALGGSLALVPLRPGTALRITLPAGPETPEGEPA